MKMYIADFVYNGRSCPHCRHSRYNCRITVSEIKAGNFTIFIIIIISGPGSSVGIATDYGLDGSGSNAGGDEIFRPSRPTLVPTQPPVKWVPALSRG